MRDDAIKWVQAMGEPMLDDDGKATQIPGTVQDITDRKNREDERSRLLTAVEQSPDTIVITDPDGKIEYANRAFEKATGFTTAEAIGQNPRIIKSGKHDEAFYKNLWDTIKGGNVWEGFFTNKRKDGTLYEELATISPVFNSDGRIISFVASKRDVSREQNLNRAREFFTHATSHELRTPLTHLKALQLLTSKLREKYPDSEEAKKSCNLADILFNNLERIVSATSLHLDISSKREIPFHKFKVVPFLENLFLETVKVVKSENRDISLSIDLERLPEETLIFGNGEILGRAINEILSNAIKYTQDGKRVDLKTSIDRGSLVIEIIDEGIGIAENEQNFLFDPYYSVENILEHSTGAYKFKGGGIGLGLTIAKLVIEYHDGTILLESEGKDKGTKATILLKLAKPYS